MIEPITRFILACLRETDWANKQYIYDLQVCERLVLNPSMGPDEAPEDQRQMLTRYPVEVDCIRDELLYDYLVDSEEHDFRRRKHESTLENKKHRRENEMELDLKMAALRQELDHEDWLRLGGRP